MYVRGENGRKPRENSNANLSFPVWNNTGHIKTSLNLNCLTEITIDLQIKNLSPRHPISSRERADTERRREWLDMERRQMGMEGSDRRGGGREKQETSVEKEGAKMEGEKAR